MKQLNQWGLCLLLGCLAAFSGCSRPADQEVAAEAALRSDVQTMQGAWCAAATNEYSMCNVIIEGYTIRLQYRKTPDDELLKKNVSIMTLDQQRSMLVMYNDAGAWSYGWEKRPEGDLLLLEFFDSVDREWARVRLMRNPKQAG